MGSKTPDEHQQHPNGGAGNETTAKIVATPACAKTGLHGSDGEGDQGDNDDDDDDDKTTNLIINNEDKKKKRKRNKKKKKTAQGGLKQSVPPRVQVSALFSEGAFPEGELQAYSDDNLSRSTGEEQRYLSRLGDTMTPEFLRDYREAAEVHRQVRQHVQSILKPGVSLTHVADEIEEGVRALTGHPGVEKGDVLKAGMGFPTGLCLNNIAAHWTPNPGGKDILLKQEDVLTIDFGVHVAGRIVDSAFTTAFDPRYDELLKSVKDATETGIKHAGIDARMSNIGAAVQEVMESYEVALNGQTYPVKAINNITGHNILRYQIHGNKQVPFVKNKSKQKMEEGEVFAIETFGSINGVGRIRDGEGVYGYRRDTNVYTGNLHLSTAKALVKIIDANFGTLPFSRRHLEHTGCKNYILGMHNLVQQGIVEQYAPFVESKGAYVAQFEHTILLRSEGKEIISRGDDY
ncbi:methionine aminopeptidase 2-like protein [Tothia fuscella]|uniref:Methionine aminopeptidase 2 n=1 Tax=Tothia fuscella TaxID=1048955 RepID=A0A9P4NZD7_9PEZI|nr:methionine aminopeptidase 2-like protein [Tothia fuscella]